MEYKIIHSDTPSCHVAYMLSFNDYIYHLAYWYKHFVDRHWSADLLFKSTDLDNTRIPSHTFWKTSLPFHILWMWWSLKIPVNKYIETWTKLVFTWSFCSLNGCFKIKPPFLPPPLPPPRYITACSSLRLWIKEKNISFIFCTLGNGKSHFINSTISTNVFWTICAAVLEIICEGEWRRVLT